MINLKNRHKVFGLLSFALTLSILAGVVVGPRKANAVVVVATDVPHLYKELGFDTIVSALVNMAVSSIASSITNWANSGFEGKPAFVQNLKKQFKTLEGKVTEDVLTSIDIGDANLGFLCGPFSSEIRNAFKIQLAIQKDSTFTKANGCTIDNILEEGGKTLKDFENDFSQGGWPAWLELTSGSNNRIGAYLAIQEEIWKKQSEAKDEQEKELSFGKGFLSQKKKGDCLVYASELDLNNGPSRADQDFVGPPPQADEEGCVQRGPEKIETPGDVISTQINNALGLSNNRIVQADEISEMLGAIATGFLTKVLTGEGGLFGASQKDPSSTEEPLTSRLGKEGEAENKRITEESRERVAGGVDQAGKQAELAEAIDKAKDRLDRCLAELSAINAGDTTIIVELGGREVTKRIDTTDTEAKQRECDKLQGELDAKRDELKALLAANLSSVVSAVGGGSDTYLCKNILTGSAASKTVTYSNAGPIVQAPSTNLRSAIDLKIPGTEVGKFYKNATIDMDVTVGPGDMVGKNRIPGIGRGFFTGKSDGKSPGYMGLDTKNDGPGGSYRLRTDAGGAGTFKTARITNAPWPGGKDYHLRIIHNAQANTLSFKATSGGTTVYEHTFTNAHPAPDLAEYGKGLYLSLEPEHSSTWTYRNIRVSMEPGGPYHGGIAWKCDGTETTSGSSTGGATAPTDPTTPDPSAVPKGKTAELGNSIIRPAQNLFLEVGEVELRTRAEQAWAKMREVPRKNLLSSMTSTHNPNTYCQSLMPSNEFSTAFPTPVTDTRNSSCYKQILTSMWTYSETLSKKLESFWYFVNFPKFRESLFNSMWTSGQCLWTKDLLTKYVNDKAQPIDYVFKSWDTATWNSIWAKNLNTSFSYYNSFPLAPVWANHKYDVIQTPLNTPLVDKLGCFEDITLKLESIGWTGVPDATAVRTGTANIFDFGVKFRSDTDPAYEAYDKAYLEYVYVNGNPTLDTPSF